MYLQLQSVDINGKESYGMRIFSVASRYSHWNLIKVYFVYYSNCILNKLWKNKLVSYFWFLNIYIQEEKGIYEQKPVVLVEHLKYMEMLLKFV